MIGKQFNEWTVLSDFTKNGRGYCKCKCSCGIIKDVISYNVKSGNSKSCGHDRGTYEVGMIVNQLTLLRKTGTTSSGNIIWECMCSCGRITSISTGNLTTGQKACGCLRTKHGQIGTKLYYVWRNIKSRCYRTSNKDYCRYGALGITVCSEWINDFKNFFEWSNKNGYKEGLQIHRKNNNERYNPDNCKWLSPSEHGKEHSK